MAGLTNINFLLTCGGGPGILAQVVALKSSKKYKNRVVLADANSASGNLYLPEVDAAYVIPFCSAGDFIPALVRIIKKEKIHFLYSGLDEEMPVIARHREEIEKAGCRVLLPHYSALLNALDKRQTHFLVKDHVRVPDTVIMENDFDAEAAYERLGGEVLIKTASSRGGRHIYLPQNYDEYVFYIDKVKGLEKTAGLSFMVQERIIGDEYNVTSLHDLNNKLIYAISRRKFETRDIKSTTTAAVIEKRQDVIDLSMAAVETLGLTPGFNNVECIVSSKDDLPYFIEVNGGRTAAQDMNIVASDINITDLMVDILTTENVVRLPHLPDGLAILKIKKDVVVPLQNIENLEKA